MNPRVEKALPWVVGVGGVALGVGLYLAMRPEGFRLFGATKETRAVPSMPLPLFLDTHEELNLGRNIDWDRLRRLERDKRIAKAMAAKGYVWSEDPGKFSNAPLGAYVLNDGVEGRIASLYRQVDEFTGAPSPMVKPLIDTSEKAFFNAATDLQLKLKDKDQWPALAQQMGVPIDAVKNGEAELVKLFKGAGFNLEKVISALHGAAGDLVLAFVRKGADIVAAEISSGLKELKGVADFGGAIPLIGQMVKVAIDLYVSYQSSVSEDFTRFAQEFMQHVYENDVMPLVDRYMPLLWNAEAAWDLTPPKPQGGGHAPKYMETPHREQWARTLKLWRQAVVPAQTVAERASQKYGETFGLPIDLAANVRKWWAGATGVMGDGRIAQVFAAMERDRQVIMTPNDEMLLPITSVVSLLEGYEPREFARLTWGFTPGWRREAELAGEPNVYAWYRANFKRRADGTFPPVTPGPHEPPMYERDDSPGLGVNMRRKAYNMASMARCAYDLVEVLASAEVQAVTGPMKVRQIKRLDTPVVAHGLEGIADMRAALRTLAPRTSGDFAAAYAQVAGWSRNATLHRMNGLGGAQMVSGRGGR